MNWILIGRAFLSVGCVALLAGAVLVGYFYFQATRSEDRRSESLDVVRQPAGELDSIDEGALVFETIHELAAAGNWQGVRQLCLRIIEDHPNSSRLPDARRIVSEMNLDSLLSRDAYPGKEIYTVRSGDSIGAVANRFRCSYPYVVRVSGLTRAPNIQPNDQLVVCPLKFRLRVVLGEALVEVIELERNQDGTIVETSVTPAPEEANSGEEETGDEELAAVEEARPPERLFAALPIVAVRLPANLPATSSFAVGEPAGVVGDQRLPSYDPGFAAAEKEIPLGSGVVLRALPEDGEPERTGLYLRRSDLEDLALILRRGQKVEFVH